MNKQEIRDLIESYQKQKNVRVYIFYSRIGLNAIKQKDYNWFRDNQAGHLDYRVWTIACNPIIEATNNKVFYLGNNWDNDITWIEWKAILNKSYYILVVKTIVKESFDEKTNEVVVTRTDKMVCVRSIKTGEIAKLNLSSSK
jgi:hypothetical protein